MLVVNPRRVRRNRVSNPLFDTFFPTVKVSGVKNRFPLINTIAEDEQLVLEVVAPGLKKEDFAIAIEEGVLNIKGKKEYKLEEGTKSLRQDFGAYNFDRKFRLSDDIDTSKISANYEAGILAITLPMKEKEAPVKISIK